MLTERGIGIFDCKWVAWADSADLFCRIVSQNAKNPRIISGDSTRVTYTGTSEVTAIGYIFSNGHPVCNLKIRSIISDSMCLQNLKIRWMSSVRTQGTCSMILSPSFLRHVIESYPWDAQNFRLAGSPVDGIASEQGKVTIVEFNTGRLRLGPNQKHMKHIRKLMSDRQVALVLTLTDLP